MASPFLHHAPDIHSIPTAATHGLVCRQRGQSPGMPGSSNINGPSLIRVPDWPPHPLGKYYLYFANHHGSYIRLAYADRLKVRASDGGAAKRPENALRDPVVFTDDDGKTYLLYSIAEAPISNPELPSWGHTGLILSH